MKSEETRGWGLALLFASIVAGALAFVPIGLEAWSHVALGRAADTFGSIPDRNLFVYTLESGQEVQILGWLAQWWIYQIQNALGWNGIIVARALMGSLALFVGILATRSPSRAVPFWAFCALALITAVGATGSMFGGAIWVLGVALVVSVGSGVRSSWWLLPIPLLLPVVVHLDSIFVYLCGLMMWCGWVLRGKLAPTLAVLSVIATLINPRGVEVWMIALNDFSLPGWQAIMLVAGAIWVWSVGHVSEPSRRFLLVGTALFGLFRSELMPFCLVAIGIIGIKPEGPKTVPIAVGFVALLVAIALQPLWMWWPPMAQALGIGRGGMPEAHVITKDTPLDSVRIIKSWGSRAQIFHDPSLAGLLMFELGVEPYPMLFTGPAEIKALQSSELYELVQSDEVVRRGIFHQYNVRAVLVDVKDTSLVEALLEDPLWRLVHEEGSWVLFAR